MIEIQLQKEDFEQDIRALLMAFYPNTPIRAVIGNDMPKIGMPPAKNQTQQEPFHENELHRLFKIDIQTDSVSIRIYDGEPACGVYKNKACYTILPRSMLYDHRFVLPADAGENAAPEEQRACRLTRKNELKKGLYEAAVSDTGRQLAWGTLTGIRPTKIPTAMLEKGCTHDEIAAHLRSEYWVSDAKSSLAVEIAERERALLSSLDYKNGYSLYIGIPFCPSTCAYCSFTSYPLSRWSRKVDQYVHCVIKELEYISEVNRDKTLNTIYFGGGTPTTLLPEQMDMLCDAIERLFVLDQVREWTVEAGRPDSITREKLLGLKRHPVTRISINPQTMKEETLRLIGRQHSVRQIREAFEMSRECGFTNINMDMILGLPGETSSDVAHTVEEICRLSPESLTVHTLARKRAARMNTDRAAFSGYSQGNTEDMLEIADQGARSIGLRPYYLYRQKNMAGNLENVGYAREGCFSLYNILIMEELQSIFAAGAGGATKLVFAQNRIERVENVKAVDQYMTRIHEMIDRKRTALSMT